MERDDRALPALAELRVTKKPSVSIVPGAGGTDASFCYLPQHCVPGYFRGSLRDKYLPYNPKPLN
jgi:hypothetical protein